MSMPNGAAPPHAGAGAHDASAQDGAVESPPDDGFSEEQRKRHLRNGDIEDGIVERDPTGRWARTNNEVGHGKFKCVWKAFDEHKGLDVAWNKIDYQQVELTPEQTDNVMEEVGLGKGLSHKNIIKMYRCWVSDYDHSVNFVTELFTSGNLRNFHKKHPDLGERTVKRFSRQILEGLAYLHSQEPPVVHGDLRCDKVYVNGHRGEIKIGDLGLATLLPKRYDPSKRLPEGLKQPGMGPHDSRVDIFAFGLLVLELVANEELSPQECEGWERLLERTDDPDARAVIRACMAPLEERPYASELLKFEWFRSDGKKALDKVRALDGGQSTASLRGVESSSAIAGSDSHDHLSRMGDHGEGIERSRTGMSSALHGSVAETAGARATSTEGAEPDAGDGRDGERGRDDGGGAREEHPPPLRGATQPAPPEREREPTAIDFEQGYVRGIDFTFRFYGRQRQEPETGPDGEEESAGVFDMIARIQKLPVRGDPPGSPPGPVRMEFDFDPVTDTAEGVTKELSEQIGDIMGNSGMKRMAAPDIEICKAALSEVLKELHNGRDVWPGEAVAAALEGREAAAAAAMAARMAAESPTPASETAVTAAHQAPSMPPHETRASAFEPRDMARAEHRRTTTTGSDPFGEDPFMASQ
ncbi:unnamed protein product [Pedinophyceae sp. YPF-701]|nr:unnamed protein product [Pedinophyceae sp. YPF-701]